MIGQQISHYRIESQLGSGTYGVVYKGVHVGDEEFKVAIKVAQPSLIDDPKFVESLKRECRRLDRLEHPGIVRFRELVLGDDMVAMVLELLEGKDLYDTVQEGPPALDQTLRIIELCLSGLAYAHSKEVIHRDIKPSNIFLCDDGRVKILDFGIARAAHSTQATQTGTLKGTLDYMAPERFSTSGGGAHSDVYAMGLVAWEMVTGQAACPDGDIPAKLGWHIGVGAPDVRTACPACPDWLADVIAKLADKNADTRPQDGAAALKLFQEAKATGGTAQAPAAAQTERPAAPGTVALDKETVAEALRQVAKETEPPPVEAHSSAPATPSEPDSEPDPEPDTDPGIQAAPAPEPPVPRAEPEPTGKPTPPSASAPPAAVASARWSKAHTLGVLVAVFLAVVVGWQGFSGADEVGNEVKLSKKKAGPGHNVTEASAFSKASTNYLQQLGFTVVTAEKFPRKFGENELWEDYNFGDIIDPETGKLLFRCDNETVLFGKGGLDGVPFLATPARLDDPEWRDVTTTLNAVGINNLDQSLVKKIYEDVGVSLRTRYNFTVNKSREWTEGSTTYRTFQWYETELFAVHVSDVAQHVVGQCRWPKDGFKVDKSEVITALLIARVNDGKTVSRRNVSPDAETLEVFDEGTDMEFALAFHATPLRKMIQIYNTRERGTEGQTDAAQ
jgi:serine/threonine protein kinase